MRDKVAASFSFRRVRNCARSLVNRLTIDSSLKRIQGGKPNSSNHSNCLANKKKRTYSSNLLSTPH